METTIKVGDILAGTWGCTMTIPVFFKVTKITPKQVKLAQYDGLMVQPTDGGYGQQGYEMPDFTRGQGDAVGMWRTCSYNGKPYLRVRMSNGEHVIPDVWDGKPVWADYMD